jgi:hypothetical protein
MDEEPVALVENQHESDRYFLTMITGAGLGWSFGYPAILVLLVAWVVVRIGIR